MGPGWKSQSSKWRLREGSSLDANAISEKSGSERTKRWHRHGAEEFALDLGLAGERDAVVSLCGALPAGRSPCEERSASPEPDRKLWFLRPNHFVEAALVGTGNGGG